MSNPKLRFKGFSYDWMFLNGNEVFIPISNKKHNSDLPILAITQEQGAIPRDLINYRISVTDKSVDSYKVVEKGDFIISLRSFQGGIEYSEYNGICSPAYIILRNKIEINKLFYKVYLKTDNYIGKLTSKLEGIRDGKMISYNYFSEIKLPFPTLPEQEKIATFFTTIDQKLNLLKEKKEKLEHYKKGVMQQIFSQKLRFKDEKGNEFPTWESYQLNDILSEHKIRNKENKVKEVFSVAKNKGVINQIEHLGRSYASKDTTNYKVTFPNDVIYTKSPTSDFPFGIIKQNKTGRTGIVSTLYGVFKPKTKYLGFILDYYFSTWENTFNYLNPLVEKGAKNTMNINNDRFLNSGVISLPSDEVEQKKITDFIKTLDAKINLVETQIQKTELWKKGLLQQMFV